MKKIMAATDLSPRSDRALRRALALANEFKAELSVLHVLDSEFPPSAADALKENAERMMAEQIAAAAPSEAGRITLKIIIGTPFMDILREAEDQNADLIVLGTHRQDMLGNFFRGTTVERVIRHGNIPVLVVRDPVDAPYRRVLVGVDFSASSRRALELALVVVPEGEFFPVHAYDVPFAGFIAGPSARDEVFRKREKRMEAMLDGEMQDFFAALPGSRAALKPIICQGTVREVLLGQVEALRPDLLVIGTHGRTGIVHSILGSVAEDLLSDPPCDVLAVKAW